MAAPPPTQGLAHGSQEEGKSRSATGNQPRHTDNHPQEIPGGETPLPPNAGDFVEEVHRETDLFKVWRSLLQSEDEKIRQRAVEKLTEMRYKGATALADESQRIIIDMPGPTRD